MADNLFERYRPDEPATKPKPEYRCKGCGGWTTRKDGHLKCPKGK